MGAPAALCLCDQPPELHPALQLIEADGGVEEGEEGEEEPPRVDERIKEAWSMSRPSGEDMERTHFHQLRLPNEQSFSHETF